MFPLVAGSDEREEEEYEKEEVGEDGEIILVSGDKMSGPWNKSSGQPQPAAPVGESEHHTPLVATSPVCRIVGCLTAQCCTN